MPLKIEGAFNGLCIEAPYQMSAKARAAVAPFTAEAGLASEAAVGLSWNQQQGALGPAIQVVFIVVNALLAKKLAHDH